MNGIIIISILAILVLFLGLYKAQKAILPVALLGLAASAGTYIAQWNVNMYYFNNMIFIDNYSIAFSVLTIVATMLILLMSPGYFERISTNVAEYVALILFSLVGVLCMICYNDLSMLFIGIEIMSICMYILAGIRKKDLISNEASLKYLLMGSFATGFLLFGIALIYGFIGSFNIETIGTVVTESGGDTAALFDLGVLLMIVGLSFKVSAAPFHFWAADVYDGAPSLITAYMSSVVKTASFVAFLKIFLVAFGSIYLQYTSTLWAISALTIVVGNLIALYQHSFKRMLAYSSISHAGYMLMAILALGDSSSNALFFYASAYTFASIIAFGVLIKVKQLKNSEDIGAFNGLAKTNPLAAFALTIAMTSMAGIPLTAGFIGKFYMFATALSQGYTWLVFIAVLSAVIGIWYYFKVIIAMYMKDADDAQVAISFGSSSKMVLWIATLASIVLGVLPGLISAIL